MLNEISQSQKDKDLMIPSILVKVIKIGSRVVVTKGWRSGTGESVTIKR